MNVSLNTAVLDTATPSSTGIGQRLPTAFALKQQLPLPGRLAAHVHASRLAVRSILQGQDPRLLVIAGPCSLHCPQAALEYAQRLAMVAREHAGQLLIVMRAYVEKPRTTVGWKGLAYDPQLDGSDDMLTGLALSRELMLEILGLGLPIATELLQPMAASYFDDLLAWGAIGARTTESQVHREMASGLGFPVGFKNGTDGAIGIACDAIRSAAHGHRHFGLDGHGHPAIVRSAGNPDGHLVLRGGHRGPNYDAQSIANARRQLENAGLPARMVVDCSHANSGKNPLNQPAVLRDILAQRRHGAREVVGVMLESNLFEGSQPLGPNLRYGVSVTDACLGWDATAALLNEAARG